MARKTEPTPVPAEPEQAPTASGKKGVPTPKRKDREAERKRGLVLDVKSDAKERRARDRARREAEYQALRTGDERNMPIEHRGPEKRFIRDYIDARTSIGEFLLPIALVFVVLTLLPPFKSGTSGAILILGFYAIVIMAGIETFLTIRRLKKALIEKFGETKVPRGFTFYTMSRALNLRRFRTPRPKNRRGEYPV